MIRDEAHRIRETSRSTVRPRPSSGRGRQAAGGGIDRGCPYPCLSPRRTPGGAARRAGHRTRRSAPSRGERSDAASRASGWMISSAAAGQQQYVEWVLQPAGALDGRGPIAVVQPRRERGTKTMTASLLYPRPTALESWLTDAEPRQTRDTARIAAGVLLAAGQITGPSTARGARRRCRIGGWRRPWNAKPEKRVPGVPARTSGPATERLRTGRLHLYRAGLRVRLVRRDLRQRLRTTRGQLGLAARVLVRHAVKRAEKSSLRWSATPTRCC